MFLRFSGFTFFSDGVNMRFATHECCRSEDSLKKITLFFNQKNEKPCFIFWMAIWYKYHRENILIKRRNYEEYLAKIISNFNLRFNLHKKVLCWKNKFFILNNLDKSQIRHFVFVNALIHWDIYSPNRKRNEWLKFERTPRVEHSRASVDSLSKAVATK